MAWKKLWTKLGSQGERDRKSKHHSVGKEDGNMSNLVYFFEDVLAEPYVCLPDMIVSSDTGGNAPQIGAEGQVLTKFFDA